MSKDKQEKESKIEETNGAMDVDNTDDPSDKTPPTDANKNKNGDNSNPMRVDKEDEPENLYERTFGFVIPQFLIIISIKIYIIFVCCDLFNTN